jgi:hypothetical protein
MELNIIVLVATREIRSLQRKLKFSESHITNYLELFASKLEERLETFYANRDDISSFRLTVEESTSFNTVSIEPRMTAFAFRESNLLLREREAVEAEIGSIWYSLEKAGVLGKDRQTKMFFGR